MSVVILSATGVESVRFDGASTATGYILRSLTGWLASTSAKVDLVERMAGDGAHDVMAAQILYAARTVSIDYRLLPDGFADRSGLLAMQSAIRRMLHRSVTVRVIDADHDLQATGYVDSVDVQQGAQNINRQFLEGQINIVCPRPELLAHDAQLLQLLPLGSAGEGEGLSYGDDISTWWMGEANNSVSVLSITPGDDGIVYPLSYGRDTSDGRNHGVLANHGSSHAYPTITVQGDWPDGVQLRLDGQYALEYSMPINSGAPLVLDCRSRTASVNGADMTRWCTQRGFVSVPPASSMEIVLTSQGNGFVSVMVADTYM